MARTGQSALVTTDWLKNVLKTNPPNHRILDVSWHLPVAKRNGAEEFKKQHIPGALFFDITVCADKSSGIPHMAPSPEEFENYVGNLGINNDTHVIVYDNHPQFPIFTAQRVWWIFRLFGHKNISILEGGLPKWISEGGPITSEVMAVKKEQFKVKFEPKLVKSYSDVEKNIKSSEYILVDARPDIKPGKVPNSINIPFLKILNLEDRKLKNVDELKKVFGSAGVDLNKPIIGSCGAGILACVVALAAFECGKDDVAIYDGSWNEWSQRAPRDLIENVPSE